jgi:hypothetical protein
MKKPECWNCPSLFKSQSLSKLSDATVTWYDARLSHEKRTEHRLYFPTHKFLCVKPRA